MNRKKVKVWEERTEEKEKVSLNTMIADYKIAFLQERTIQKQ